VHNGKEFKRVDITADRVGKRLGEFSHSTGRVLHSGPGVGATRGSKFVPLK
jgi:small subunit ribosomal protein S19